MINLNALNSMSIILSPQIIILDFNLQFNNSLKFKDIVTYAKLVKNLDHNVTSTSLDSNGKAFYSETRGKCFVISPSSRVCNKIYLNFTWYKYQFFMFSKDPNNSNFCLSSQFTAVTPRFHSASNKEIFRHRGFIHSIRRRDF